MGQKGAARHSSYYHRSRGRGMRRLFPHPAVPAGPGRCASRSLQSTRARRGSNMHRTVLIAVLCFAGIAAPLCDAATFSDCGSKVGSFTAIKVSGCGESKTRCDLVRETNASIEIDFTTTKDVSKVEAVVHGIIMDVPIPFPLPHADACSFADSGLTCPMNQGGSYTYKTSMFIQKAYPKVSVDIKFELKDENGDDITCAIIPAKIK